MADIRAEYAQVEHAFAQPTLRLLHRKDAPVVFALFRALFGADTLAIPTARLHTQVEAMLDELRLGGVDGLPEDSGAELCKKWMRADWMVRFDQDGEEVYQLTSHAQFGLDQVRGLMHERANLSEHSITTIIDFVRRFNTEANPDRDARVALLEADIARLSAQRERLLAGGELGVVSEDYMLEGYVRLLNLTRSLPSEFARVQEAYERFRTELLADFRAERRPLGEVVEDYLRRMEQVNSATAEGRAFEGAFALLRDEALLAQLHEDLHALLTHPLAADILGVRDRRDLAAVVTLIEAGLNRVLATRTRVNKALRDIVMTHDPAQDRELDQVLRQLTGVLADFMEVTGPMTKVPLELLPARRLTLAHLRERFHDAREDLPLPDLPETEQEPQPPPLADLLAQGGPTIEVLRAHLHAALDEAISAAAAAGQAETVEEADELAARAAQFSLAAVFNDLTGDLRRPVEILGLLHLASNDDRLVSTAERETFHARRPDGSTRLLSGPVFRARVDLLAGIAGQQGTDHPADHTADDGATISGGNR